MPSSVSNDVRRLGWRSTTVWRACSSAAACNGPRMRTPCCRLYIALAPASVAATQTPFCNAEVGTRPVCGLAEKALTPVSPRLDAVTASSASACTARSERACSDGASSTVTGGNATPTAASRSFRSRNADIESSPASMGDAVSGTARASWCVRRPTHSLMNCSSRATRDACVGSLRSSSGVSVGALCDSADSADELVRSASSWPARNCCLQL